MFNEQDIELQQLSKENNFSIIINKAIEIQNKGHYDDAEKLYQVVLREEPNHPDALHLLGLNYHKKGNNKRSIKLIRQAIRINSKEPMYFENLGLISQNDDDLVKAANYYKQAIKLNPKKAKPYSQLGLLQFDMGLFKPALHSFKKSFERDPNNIDVLINYGVICTSNGHYKEALKQVERILSRRPLYPEALALKFTVRSLLGEIHAAQPYYHWIKRLKSYLKSNPTRHIPYPLVHNLKQIKNKTILVMGDQGIGDEIMFSSLLPVLKKYCNNIYFACTPRLISLMQRAYPEVLVFERSPDINICLPSYLGKVDFQIELSSLMPLFFKKEYIHKERFFEADAHLRRHWQHRLSQLDEKFNIGISWFGGGMKQSQNTKSIPLSFWAPLLAIPNVNFINLQYGKHRNDIEEIEKKVSKRITTFEDLDPIASVDDVYAVIAECNLIISVDNSTVHIAATLGVTTWALLPKNSDWRWWNSHPSSHWHKHLELIKAPELGFSGKKKLITNIAKKLSNSLQNKDEFTPSLAVKNNKPTDVFIDESHSQTPSALIINDTINWNHWGLSCSALAVHYSLRQQYEKVEAFHTSHTQNMKGLPETLEDFDSDEIFERFTELNSQIIEKIKSVNTIVINGEGDMYSVHTSPIGLLFLAYIAKKRFLKNTRIINHSCYPVINLEDHNSIQINIYKKVYATFDFIAVREANSYKLLKKIGIACEQSFDCLPLFLMHQYDSIHDPVKKCILFTGSPNWSIKSIDQIGTVIEKLLGYGFQTAILVGSNPNIAKSDSVFIQLLHTQINKGCKLIFAESEHEWLNQIENSSLLISSYLQHIVAASMLKTPFITTENKTPEISGVLDLIGIHNLIDIDSENFSQHLFSLIEDIHENPKPHIINEEKATYLQSLSMKNFE